jgi:hypothetical protein
MMGHILLYKIDAWLINISWHYETVMGCIYSRYIFRTVQFLSDGGCNGAQRTRL